VRRFGRTPLRCPQVAAPAKQNVIWAIFSGEVLRGTAVKDETRRPN
jgi:hypothetical protein